jgi:hypothetical protein
VTVAFLSTVFNWHTSSQDLPSATVCNKTFVSIY